MGGGAVCSMGLDLRVGLITLLELLAKQGWDCRLQVQEWAEALLTGLTEALLQLSNILRLRVTLLLSWGETLLRGCMWVLLWVGCEWVWSLLLMNEPCSEVLPLVAVLPLPTLSWVTSIILLLGFSSSCTSRWWIQSTYSFSLMLNWLALVFSCCSIALTLATIFSSASLNCLAAFSTSPWQFCSIRRRDCAQLCFTCAIPLSSYLLLSFCSSFLSKPSLILSTIFLVSLTTICIFFSMSSSSWFQWLSLTCCLEVM